MFDLYFKGASCREIAAALGGKVSFKTVANDINWWERQAELEISQHKNKLALAHKKSKANFEYLLKKAHEQFERAEKEKNEDRMIELYPIIESLVADLQAIETAGDIVDRELQQRMQRFEKQLVVVRRGQQKEEEGDNNNKNVKEEEEVVSSQR